MKRIELALVIVLATASVALALAFILQDLWIWAGLSFVPALFWWWLRQRGLAWLPGTGFTVYMLSAAMGVLAGLPATLMLVCAAAGLAAWDLERFSVRLKQAPEDSGTAELQVAHLKRLFFVILFGVGLGVLALNLEIQLSLLPTAVLALLIVYALGRVIKSSGS